MNKFCMMAICLSTVLGCNSTSEKKLEQKNNSIQDESNTIIVDTIMDNDMPAYTSEQLKRMQAERLKAAELNHIDTSLCLRKLDTIKLETSIENIFDQDMLTDVANTQLSLDPCLTKILNIQHIIAKIHISDKFNSYLCYQELYESHYGPAIVLIHISDNNAILSSFTLAQTYMSENYEYVLESELMDTRQIKLKKTKYHGAHGNREQSDSIIVEQTLMYLDDNGNFKVIG